MSDQCAPEDIREACLTVSKGHDLSFLKSDTECTVNKWKSYRPWTKEEEESLRAEYEHGEGELVEEEERAVAGEVEKEHFQCSDCDKKYSFSQTWSCKKKKEVEIDFARRPLSSNVFSVKRMEGDIVDTVRSE